MHHFISVVLRYARVHFAMVKIMMYNQKKLVMIVGLSYEVAKTSTYQVQLSQGLSEVQLSQGLSEKLRGRD